MLSFYYIAKGEMYRSEDGKSVPLRSGVLDSYTLKIKDIAERNEWKYNGQGAAFTGSFGNAPSAEQSVSSIYSCVTCVDEVDGDLIYAIDIDHTGGIYRKREGTSEGIVLCSSNTAYRDFDIRCGRIAASAAFAGESHIGVMNMGEKGFITYTEGHSVDSSPAWSAVDKNKIYFCSQGLPVEEKSAPDRIEQGGFGHMLAQMYSASEATVLGPASLCVLDISSGTLEELLSDVRYDYLHPQSTADGALYYIRRPYQQSGRGSGALGCLGDVLMMPVRLIQALFGFLNVFSAKYSGKTLSRSDVKRRDEGQMYIDGNLINAERELRDAQRRKDKNPGIIPRSWELHRRLPDGTDEIVRRGVVAFRVMRDGDILFSNGSAVINLRSDGTEEKILNTDGVVYIK